MLSPLIRPHFFVLYFPLFTWLCCINFLSQTFLFSSSPNNCLTFFHLFLTFCLFCNLLNYSPSIFDLLNYSVSYWSLVSPGPYFLFYFSFHNLKTTILSLPNFLSSFSIDSDFIFSSVFDLLKLLLQLFFRYLKTTILSFPNFLFLFRSTFILFFLGVPP